MPNWSQVLNEIGDHAREHTALAQKSVDVIRRKYLNELHHYTQRNVIAYYSGFLSKPRVELTEIVDEDKNGLMMAIHGLDKSLGLDLILHTPGGAIATAETMVDYLKQIFRKNIRAIVPQIAMSAGTMIACACSEIVMGKHSNLGPIDPQLAGIPAAGVKEEFKRVIKEYKKDPASMQFWQHIVRQYPPSFLNQCENAVDWATSFVRTELEANMLAAKTNRKTIARKIVRALSDFSGNKAHDRHIHYDECHSIGLNVSRLEDDQTLQDLVLTVHHCYMHALMNTAAFKIIENHNGAAFVKQQIQTVQFIQQQP